MDQNSAHTFYNSKNIFLAITISTGLIIEFVLYSLFYDRIFPKVHYLFSEVINDTINGLKKMVGFINFSISDKAIYSISEYSLYAAMLIGLLAIIVTDIKVVKRMKAFNYEIPFTISTYLSSFAAMIKWTIVYLIAVVAIIIVSYLITIGIVVLILVLFFGITAIGKKLKL